MRRKIITRLLVFCMIVSMLAVPAMATDDGWTRGESSDTYTVSSGTATLSSYTITKNTYVVLGSSSTLNGSITVSGGALYVYTTDSSSATLGANITVSGDNSFYYQTSSGTVTFKGKVSRNNYTLNGWKTTTLDSKTYSYPTWTYNGGTPTSPSSSPSSGSTTTTSSSTEVTAKTTVSGDTATVTVDSKAVTSAVTAAESSADKTVTIDASKAGADVTTVTVQASVLETVSDASGVSLTIEMPASDVTLSDAALAAVVAEAGTNVSLTLETSAGTESLAAAQKESLTGLATGVTITASLESNGKAITSFGGGSVTLSVPFTAPAANRPANKFGVYHVAPTGGLTRQPTSYANGKLSFTTTHFSDFVAVYEPFADVTADLWYAQYALYASDHGIMNGTDKGFEGNLNLTRAMMVQTFYNMKNRPTGAASGAFADVADGAWYADAVNWGAANGVANGMGAGNFAPNADMTREQMAQFLYNYAKANGKDVSKAGDLSQFADASSVSDWAKEAMAWAVGQGYINGMDGKLNPQGTATRAQVATVLTRFAQA